MFYQAQDSKVSRTKACCNWWGARSQASPQTLKHQTSPMDVGTTTMPDQRFVAAGGEEDHLPHPQTMEHPTSPMDDVKPTEPDIPTVFIESRHDDGRTSSKP